MNQGLSSGLQSNLQTQVPAGLMPTMPLTTSSDHNHPLRSLSQDLGPIPFQPMSMSRPMFSETSGSLFAGPKPISPSSSSALQLSSNTSSPTFGYFPDSKSMGTTISGSAQMSATALLQKAAQMGATASNNSINSPMTQKNLVTSMAGPDHNASASISKPPFSASEPSSFDHFQSNVAGISGSGGTLTNQLFQRVPQEISELFDATDGAASATTGSAISGMGMFSQIFLASDHQNPAGLMMKNHVERDNGTTSSGLIMHGRDVGEENPMGPNMATVHDFLGVGGSANFREPEQQRLELDAMNLQRVSVMNHHFQHHLPHGDSPLDKPIWDV